MTDGMETLQMEQRQIPEITGVALYRRMIEEMNRSSGFDGHVQIVQPREKESDAARLLNAASLHGIQMDSLADMVTFGVAPATVVAVMAHALYPLRPRQFILVWCLCAVYLGCAALRLAKYNVHAMLEKKSSEKFSGLPSPGAAAALCSIIIFYAVDGGPGRQILQKLLAFLPYYAALLGLLMVSNNPYQHFGKWIFSIPRHKKRLLIVVIVMGAACYEPALVALILINGYVIWGPLAQLAVKLGLLKSASDANI